MHIQKESRIAFLLPLLAVLFLATQSATAQRVAPGVPPQHYQQPQYQQPNQHHQPPPQQYQQQQVPQQQIPQQQIPQQQMQHAPNVAPQHYQQQQQGQYQQVPVQQQQQPHVQQPVAQQQQYQQQQQVPHGQPHMHPGGAPAQVLNAANLEHERAHIQEHMQVPIDTSKMSEAELQFHYFKMHDSDNNNKLDGCELIKSLIHWHVHEPNKKQDANETNSGTGEKEGVIYDDKSLADVIDYVLSSMDLNKDGYVDYTEYRKSEEANARPPGKEHPKNN